MVQQESSPEVVIKGLQAYEVFNSEGQVTCQLDYNVQYLAKTFQVATNIPFLKTNETQNILYDDDSNRLHAKGMNKAATIINQQIKQLILN
jgi:hypothetical protein